MFGKAVEADHMENGRVDVGRAETIVGVVGKNGSGVVFVIAAHVCGRRGF